MLRGTKHLLFLIENKSRSFAYAQDDMAGGSFISLPG
jgi:hypothetical protein